MVDLFTNHIDPDSPEGKALLKALNGDDEDDESGEDTLARIEKAFEDKKVQQRLDKALDNAKMRSEHAEEARNSTQGFDLSPGDLREINDFENMYDSIKSIVLNLTHGDEIFRFISGHARSMMQDHSKLSIGNFIDDEDFVDFVDFTAIHMPEFGLFLEDISVSVPSRKDSVDLYIDISGSMGNTVNPRGELPEAKAIALRLLAKGMVGDVYFFDTSLYGPYQDSKTIVQIESGGGTDFDLVVQKASETGRPAVCLTDGMSSVSHSFYDKLLWIGVGGNDLSGFTREGNNLYPYYTAGRCFTHSKDSGIVKLK
jgi:hypothetical protein